jgi:hypothetical protein
MFKYRDICRLSHIVHVKGCVSWSGVSFVPTDLSSSSDKVGFDTMIDSRGWEKIHKKGLLDH